MILVVEDHVDLRTLLLMVLGAAGYTASGAGTGKDALRIIRDERPSLVILDLGLPDVDGKHVLGAIRHTAAAKDLPVVIYSAVADPDEWASAGATAFLQKGRSDIDELLSTVRNILSVAA